MPLHAIIYTMMGQRPAAGLPWSERQLLWCQGFVTTQRVGLLGHLVFVPGALNVLVVVAP